MPIEAPLAVERLRDRYWNERSVGDANPGGMGADGHRQNLPALAEAMGVVAEAMLLAGLFQVATSTTEATIGDGARALAVEQNKGFAAGMFVIAYPTADPSVSMTGRVDSYTAATGALAFTVATGHTRGAGTYSAWTVALSAVPGVQGPAGSIEAGGTLGGGIDANGQNITGGGVYSAEAVVAGTALTVGGATVKGADDTVAEALAHAIALNL